MILRYRVEQQAPDGHWVPVGLIWKRAGSALSRASSLLAEKRPVRVVDLVRQRAGLGHIVWSVQR